MDFPVDGPGTRRRSRLAAGVDQGFYAEVVKVVNYMALILIAVISTGILGLGLELRSDQSPYADGIVTTATTTSFRTERSTTRKRRVWTTRYRPVYTFQTRTGEATYDDPSTVREPPQLGRTVELSYRPSEPGRARVLRGWHGWTVFPVMFTVIGAGLLAFIVYALGVILIRSRVVSRP